MTFKYLKEETDHISHEEYRMEEKLCRAWN